MILACDVFQLDTQAALVTSSCGAGKPAGSGKARALPWYITSPFLGLGTLGTGKIPPHGLGFVTAGVC